MADDVVGLEVAAVTLRSTTPAPGRVGVESPPRGDLRPALHRGIAGLRDDVVAMGELVERAVDRAARAVVGRDAVLADAVVEGDRDVNLRNRLIQDGAYRILVRESPMCGDLRRVMASMAMAGELERIGDHSVSVAKQARMLADLPLAPLPDDLAVLATLCRRQVRDILQAMAARDATAARTVAARDDEVDAAYHRVRAALAEPPAGDPLGAYRATVLALVSLHLERIGDRVTNLAEDVVFAVTGAQDALG